MEHYKNKKLKFLFFFVLLFLFGFFVKADKIFAEATAVIQTSPLRGSFETGETFRADIVIDGKGTAFNAAKAKVIVSKNLEIKNLTFGDCNFAFVATPTINDPSFAGVILGGSSSKCPVYTLFLKAVSAGSSSVIMTNASVKSYDKSLEILSSLQNGVYTISQSQQSQSGGAVILTPTNSPPSEANNSSYSLAVEVQDEKGDPLEGASVTLDSPQQDKADIKMLSGKDGVANFSDLNRGVYNVEVEYEDEKISEKVVNLSGDSKTLAFGIKADKKFDYKWFILVLVPLLILAFYIYLKKGRVS